MATYATLVRQAAEIRDLARTDPYAESEMKFRLVGGPFGGGRANALARALLVNDYDFDFDVEGGWTKVYSFTVRGSVRRLSRVADVVVDLVR